MITFKCKLCKVEIDDVFVKGMVRFGIPNEYCCTKCVDKECQSLEIKDLTREELERMAYLLIISNLRFEHGLNIAELRFGIFTILQQYEDSWSTGRLHNKLVERIIKILKNEFSPDDPIHALKS
jgi:hypothetical protein